MSNSPDQSAATPKDQPIDPAKNELSPHSSADRAGDSQPSDSLRLPVDVRGTVQELLRQGYLEESQKPDLFRKAIIYESQINAALDPLDLCIKLDTYRGIALVKVRDDLQTESGTPPGADDQWSHPLVRRQRLTLEQSLLIAILRGVFVLHEQETGVGERLAKVSVDELLPQYLTYIEDSGSDSRNEARLMTVLDQLKGYGTVSEVDSNHEITIRPLIAHLADPEALSALLQTMRAMAQTKSEADFERGDPIS